MLSSGNCAVIGHQLGGGGGFAEKKIFWEVLLLVTVMLLRCWFKGGGGEASVVRNSVFSSEIDQVMLSCFSSVDRGEMAI